MLRWIIGVTLGILAVAAIGTAIVLLVIPGEVTVTVVESERSPVPSDLSAEPAAGPLAIQLTWTGEIDSSVTAVLERSTVPEDETSWQALATLEPGATAYLDHDIEPGTTYFYRISASTPEGGSGISNVASAEGGS